MTEPVDRPADPPRGGPADPPAERGRDREWWDDPRLPWKGKPTRADILCWTGFAASGAYAFATIPLRPALLATNPLALAALTGSRTAVVAIGALAAVGRMDWWPLGIVLAALSVMKFDWVFWWAGRLWGHRLVEVVAGRSAGSARRAARAERLARRFGAPAILITYVAPVVPANIVYATVGAAGMRLRTFLLVDLAGAFASRCLYAYLGYRIGQPAVEVLDAIADNLLWVTLGLVVVAVVGALVPRRRAAAGRG